MKVRKIISLLLCILMTLTCLCACNEGEEQETEPVAVTPPVNGTDVEINLADLGSYILVRSEYASVALVEKVVALNAKIEKHFGERLKIKDDFVKEGVATLQPSEFEIIIGNTRREETASVKSGYRYDDYGYTIVGKKIVIFAHHDEAAIKAIDLFISEVVSKIEEGKDNILKLSACKSVFCEYSLDSVKVNDTLLKEYTVVYPNKGTNAENEMAAMLAEHLSKVTGYPIGCESDKDFKYSADNYELLVGSTNRTVEAPTDLKGEESFISAKGKQIVITGGGYLGIYNAVEIFKKMLDDNKQGKEVALTLDSHREILVSEVVKAMSFNVWVSQKTTERSERVLTMIKNYTPDVLGVQEASPAWMTTLKNGLTAYACVGGGRDGGTKGEHSAIFYLKDKYTLLESGTKWLSDTPDAVSKYSESSLNRILSYAVLKRNSDGKVFVHVNTHYDHTSDVARKKQSQALVKIIEELSAKYPVVLTGDFNTTKGSDAYNTIIGAGFSNSFDIALEKQEKPTFHSYGSASKIIDFCFVSKGKISVTKYDVCTEMINGDYCSDHHPVYIEFIY